ncbi:adenosylcobinamide-GDP ribazoletransferase [Jeotgalibacillus haloalkalitolerans]|uniref:Adenosylcobinamide-GDP ribazoletransferase n=1 Tax=Jeotgalibacillus haloalkalitolerans TaxID=3104292 RepID=A0ABU5KJ69_9BACL|nr:adenosylcobinamide-GDP ribazoletransferase [Jeotgalibacillus sp. HH7-29]MDZ5711194.1 adenosylcobinamide-GDP ribazoletransferase [Jeotgalibacillus sp. HH7-29]
MLKGFLLAIQFFTVLPIRREIDMNQRTVNWMIGLLPLIGAIIGSVSISVEFTADHLFSVSPLITAFLICLTLIVLTGGLHLDGWTDVSDAYFSYRDVEKRHEILKDPRVGAFGVLSLIVLLASKFILLLDLAMQGVTDWLWLFWIPVLSRLMIAVLLVKAQLARQEGMAHYLKRYLTDRVLLKAGVVSLVLLIPLLFSPGLWPLLAVLLAGAVIFTFMNVIFFKKAFGGISGDTLGASVEGGELWSLILVWCYLSIVMG